MDDLDRLLERAGNAGDMEAEALAFVARELRTLSAHMEDVKQAIRDKARTEGLGEIRRELVALRSEVQALAPQPMKARKAG